MPLKIFKNLKSGIQELQVKNFALKIFVIKNYKYLINVINT